MNVSIMFVSDDTTLPEVVFYMERETEAQLCVWACLKTVQ